MKTIIILSIIISLITAYGVYEVFQLTYRRFDHIYADMKLGMKAVVITDLHNGRLYNSDLTRIALEKPDCILIAGDLLTSGEKKYSFALKSLEALSGIADIYYSLGNHELRYREDNPSEWSAFLEELPDNCFVLDDTHKSFNDALEIFGISLNLKMYKKGRIYDCSSEVREVFKDIPANKRKLLLAHDADLYEYYEKVLNPDFIISGHLHGGFIRLPFIGGLVFARYGVKHRDKGLYAGKHLVSSGAGEHLFPLRLFNRCEIVILEL